MQQRDNKKCSQENADVLAMPSGFLLQAFPRGIEDYGSGSRISAASEPLHCRSFQPEKERKHCSDTGTDRWEIPVLGGAAQGGGGERV